MPRAMFNQLKLSIMEKVYVVYNSCISDYEDCSSTTRVFKKLPDAQEYMRNEFEDAVSDMTECDCKEEMEMCCEIWEDGDYTRNHYKIMIQECEIE